MLAYLIVYEIRFLEDSVWASVKAQVLANPAFLSGYRRRTSPNLAMGCAFFFMTQVIPSATTSVAPCMIHPTKQYLQKWTTMHCMQFELRWRDGNKNTTAYHILIFRFPQNPFKAWLGWGDVSMYCVYICFSENYI